MLYFYLKNRKEVFFLAIETTIHSWTCVTIVKPYQIDDQNFSDPLTTENRVPVQPRSNWTSGRQALLLGHNFHWALISIVELWLRSVHDINSQNRDQSAGPLWYDACVAPALHLSTKDRASTKANYKSANIPLKNTEDIPQSPHTAPEEIFDKRFFLSSIELSFPSWSFDFRTTIPKSMIKTVMLSRRLCGSWGIYTVGAGMRISANIVLWSSSAEESFICVALHHGTHNETKSQRHKLT